MSPSPENVARATDVLIGHAAREDRNWLDIRADVALALDAAEQRGRDAERAACVADLRSGLDELYRIMLDPKASDVTSTRAQAMREALASKADRIEAGEHHEPKEKA